MKKALFLMFTLMVSNLSAQQKLIAETTNYFQISGLSSSYDTISYHYNGWQGSLAANEPIYSFLEGVYTWRHESPQSTVLADSIYSYNYDNLIPILVSSDTVSNTISNGRILQKDHISPQWRTEYTHDSFGRLTNLEFLIYSNGSWQNLDRITTEYDFVGNLTAKNHYYYANGIATMHRTDTFSYNASNQLIDYAKHVYTSQTNQWYTAVKSVLFYTGNELTSIDYYEGYPSIPLTISYKFDYYYTAGKASQITTYSYFGAVPIPTPLSIVSFTYGANQKLISQQATLNGENNSHINYYYDNQDFLNKIDFYGQDGPGQVIYLNKEIIYYYVSTAGIEENEEETISIYPNPVQDVLSIAATDKVENVQIYSISGKIMIEQNSTDINVSVLPAGAYIAHIKTASGMSQARFVKN